MFRHLDDPSPPGTSPGTLSEVLARASRRRRRQLQAAMGVASAVTLAMGILIGIVVPRPSSAQADMTFSAQVGPLARGTVVPQSALVHVVFFDKTDGYALAVHGTETVLAVSTDAGDTWRVADAALPVRSPAQLEFAGASHGFLWGGTPSASGAVPLWITADAGRSWKRASIGPVVSDVSAIEGDVWALVGSCPISTATSASSTCQVAVEMSSDFGATWHSSSAAPPVRENNALAISDQDIELARTSHAHAYVLTFSSTSSTTDSSTSASAGGGQLEYTPDSGHSWITRQDPCPVGFSYGQELAASSSEDLWLTCASQGVRALQAKALFRSDDGGRAWTPAAAGNFPILSANVTVPASGGFPTGGYVAPYSLGHDNLAVLSTATAWLFPDRAGVLETTDGGRSWKSASGLVEAGFVVGGSGNVVFVDPTHGWVCEIGTGLWRTENGVTWEALGS